MPGVFKFPEGLESAEVVHAKARACAVVVSKFAMMSPKTAPVPARVQSENLLMLGLAEAIERYAVSCNCAKSRSSWFRLGFFGHH